MGAIRGSIVLPDGILQDGTVEWEGNRFTRVARSSGPGERLEGYILPGLVDIHCHGGGGVSFPDATREDEVRTAVMEHRRAGTTGLGAASSTMDLERMEFVLELLSLACDDDLVEAVEIEGPFLSRERCGSQNPLYLLAPDVEVADRLIEAAGGHAWGMTIAPELEGAEELVRHLAARGVVPTWGHTNSDDETARRLNEVAVEALRASGASPTSYRPVANHLFNAMRELAHRAPGPAAEYLAAAHRGDAVVELIGDGIHVAINLVRTTAELIGPDAMVLVTDSMAAAGMPDGTYELSGLLVHVTNGVARLRGGNLAGGTSHLIDVVRTTVRAGVPLHEAVRMASMTPANVIGRTDLGRIEVGCRADLVWVDEDLNVREVIRAGEPVQLTTD